MLGGADARQQLNGYLNLYSGPLAEAYARAATNIADRAVPLKELSAWIELELSYVPPLVRQNSDQMWDSWINSTLRQYWLQAVDAGGKSFFRAKIEPVEKQRGPTSREEPDPVLWALRGWLARRESWMKDYLGDEMGKKVLAILRLAADNKDWGAGTAARDLRSVLRLLPADAERILRDYESDRRAGLSSEEARKRAKAAGDKKLKERADRFAQHELAQMWNKGVLESVKERVRTGEIDPNTKKVWLTVDDDRVCPICGPLHKEELELDAEFESEGFRGETPPAHISCRCALAYRRRPTDDELDAAGALAATIAAAGVAAAGGVVSLAALIPAWETANLWPGDDAAELGKLVMRLEDRVPEPPSFLPAEFERTLLVRKAPRGEIDLSTLPDPEHMPASGWWWEDWWDGKEPNWRTALEFIDGEWTDNWYDSSVPAGLMRAVVPKVGAWRKAWHGPYDYTREIAAGIGPLTTALYKDTQAWLAKLGLLEDDYVILFRGGRRKAHGGVFDQMLPLESWTTSLADAIWYAEEEGAGVVSMARVARRDIFSVAGRGIGATHHNEVLVRGPQSYPAVSWPIREVPDWADLVQRGPTKMRLSADPNIQWAASGKLKTWDTRNTEKLAKAQTAVNRRPDHVNTDLDVFYGKKLAEKIDRRLGPQGLAAEGFTSYVEDIFTKADQGSRSSMFGLRGLLNDAQLSRKVDEVVRAVYGADPYVVPPRGVLPAQMADRDRFFQLIQDPDLKLFFHRVYLRDLHEDWAMAPDVDLALLFQHAVAEEFQFRPSDYASEWMFDVRWGPEQVAYARVVARAIYEQEQDYIRRATGLRPTDYITLYRGMATDPDEYFGGAVDIELNPLSSFTTDPKIAWGFGYGEEVYVIRAQVQDIFSVGGATPGLGTFLEREVVVMGNAPYVAARRIVADDLRAAAWSLAQKDAGMRRLLRGRDLSDINVDFGQGDYIALTFTWGEEVGSLNVDEVLAGALRAYGVKHKSTLDVVLDAVEYYGLRPITHRNIVVHPRASAQKLDQWLPGQHYAGRFYDRHGPPVAALDGKTVRIQGGGLHENFFMRDPSEGLSSVVVVEQDALNILKDYLTETGELDLSALARFPQGLDSVGEFNRLLDALHVLEHELHHSISPAGSQYAHRSLEAWIEEALVERRARRAVRALVEKDFPLEHEYVEVPAFRISEVTWLDNVLAYMELDISGNTPTRWQQVEERWWKGWGGTPDDWRGSYRWAGGEGGMFKEIFEKYLDDVYTLAEWPKYAVPPGVLDKFTQIGASAFGDYAGYGGRFAALVGDPRFRAQMQNLYKVTDPELRRTLANAVVFRHLEWLTDNKQLRSTPKNLPARVVSEPSTLRGTWAKRNVFGEGLAGEAELVVDPDFMADLVVWVEEKGGSAWVKEHLGVEAATFYHDYVVYEATTSREAEVFHQLIQRWVSEHGPPSKPKWAWTPTTDPLEHVVVKGDATLVKGSILQDVHAYMGLTWDQLDQRAKVAKRIASKLQSGSDGLHDLQAAMAEVVRSRLTEQWAKGEITANTAQREFLDFLSAWRGKERLARHIVVEDILSAASATSNLHRDDFLAVLEYLRRPPSMGLISDRAKSAFHPEVEIFRHPEDAHDILTSIGEGPVYGGTKGDDALTVVGELLAKDGLKSHAHSIFLRDTSSSMRDRGVSGLWSPLLGVIRVRDEIGERIIQFNSYESFTHPDIMDGVQTLLHELYHSVSGGGESWIPRGGNESFLEEALVDFLSARRLRQWITEQFSNTYFTQGLIRGVIVPPPELPAFEALSGYRPHPTVLLAPILRYSAKHQYQIVEESVAAFESYLIVRSSEVGAFLRVAAAVDANIPEEFALNLLKMTPEERIKVIKDMLVAKARLEHVPADVIKEVIENDPGRFLREVGIYHTKKAVAGQPPTRSVKELIRDVLHVHTGVTRSDEALLWRDHADPYRPARGEAVLTELSESEVKALGQRTLKAYEDRYEGRGDPVLKRIAELQGFTGLPEAVPLATFERMVRLQGQEPLWRGVVKLDFAQAFIAGEYFPGTGVAGSGTYVDIHPGVAYAFSGGEGGSFIRMTLRPNARVIAMRDLYEEMQATVPRQGHEYLRRILYDPGRFATYKGYDAIDLRGWMNDSLLGTYLILNRTAVIVVDRPLTWAEVEELLEMARMLGYFKRKEA